MVTVRENPGSYALPLLLALAVHAAVVAVLWVNWTPTVDTSRIIRPHIVKAELLVMKSKPKQAAKPQPQQAPPSKPAPKPVPRVEPKPAPKPETVPKPAPRPDPAIAKRAEDARRAQALERLSTSAFDDALAREAAELATEGSADVAQSYFDRMREDIIVNWSRPPSARNGMTLELLLELVPTGDLVSVSVTKSSGNEALDRSAVMAVQRVGKFEVPRESAVFERYFRRFPLPFLVEGLQR